MYTHIYDFLGILDHSLMFKCPRTLQTKLQTIHLSSIQTTIFFSHLKQYSQQLYIWTTVFTTVLLEKIFTISNVVSKCLKTVILSNDVTTKNTVYFITQFYGNQWELSSL